MELQNILDEIKANLTGDPQKDGPYLNEQSEKFRNEDFSKELDKELAAIMYDVAENDYRTTLETFLDVENKQVNEKLDYVEKRFRNKNYIKGIEILEEIIRNNCLAWIDTDECTYKSFGTPLEYLLYKNLYEKENNSKKIKPINCNLAKVYYLYSFGLMQKNRYEESLRAMEKAHELNPVDPELYVYYIELCKKIHDNSLLKMCADMLLKCAVTKEQVGLAYFTYSYLYSEIYEYETALALLQMSKIFRDSPLYKTELDYIKQQMHISADPRMYNSNELMNILIAENIQPGPSSAVVHLANSVAKQFEDEGKPEFAKRFFEIVYDLTEDQKTLEHIQEIPKTIK